MTVERDEHGFVAPAPLGHPGRLGLPPGHSTGPARLGAMGVELQTWRRRVDIRAPWYAHGELASECRPLDMPSAEHDVVDAPQLRAHMGHGQREGTYDAMPHLRPLFFRKIRANPAGPFGLMAKRFRFEWAARRRARDHAASTSATRD